MASLLLEDVKERIGIFVLNARLAVCSHDQDAHRVIR